MGRVFGEMPLLPTGLGSLFKANAANPTVRDERGACGNVSHGGTRNPLHKPKGCMMETLHLMLRVPYFYPDPDIPPGSIFSVTEVDLRLGLSRSDTSRDVQRGRVIMEELN